MIPCDEAGAKHVETTSLHGKCEAKASVCPLVAGDSIAPQPLHVSRLVVNEDISDFMSAEVKAAISN